MRRIRTPLIIAMVVVVAGAGSSNAKYPQGIVCGKKYTVHEALVYGRKVMPSPTRGQNGRLDVLQWCQKAPSRRQTIRRWRDRHEQIPWAIPTYVVMCESGGQNLPPNSASASGFYQFLQSTWLEFGGGRYASEAYLATRAEQDVIARRAWGNTSWDCA